MSDVSTNPKGIAPNGVTRLSTSGMACVACAFTRFNSLGSYLNPGTNPQPEKNSRQNRTHSGRWAMGGRMEMAFPSSGQKRSVSYNKLYRVGIRFYVSPIFHGDIYSHNIN